MAFPVSIPAGAAGDKMPATEVAVFTSLNYYTSNPKPKARECNMTLKLFSLKPYKDPK